MTNRYSCYASWLNSSGERDSWSGEIPATDIDDARASLITELRRHDIIGKLDTQVVLIHAH